MATSFTTVTDWMGNIDPERENGGRRPPGAAYEAPSGYTWMRTVSTINLHRFGQDIIGFTPRNGELETGNNISFTNGGDTLTGQAGDQYECMDNNLLPSPQGSGIWREEIVWRNEGAWQEVESDTDSRT